MPLIVEVGSIVPGADSYINLVDARTFAAKYGLVLPTDDDEAEAALIHGLRFLRRSYYKISQSSANKSP